MKHALTFTAGNPFIFRYWLRFWDSEMASRFDQLYVGQWGSVNPDSMQVILDLCKERNIILSSNCSSSEFIHQDVAASLNLAYSAIKNPGEKDDFIALFHTDNYVFDGNVIDEYFDLMEKTNIRIIGEVKAGIISYWPDEPNRTDTRQVDQIWPSWVFAYATDWHYAYTKVLEEMKKANFPIPDGKGFSSWKGNEEWVLMAHFLQSTCSEECLKIVGQERAHHSNVLNAYDIFEWFHFGCLEQMPVEGGVFRDKNNIPLIYSPKQLNKIELHPLEQHPSAKGLSTVQIGMFKACVITGNDHPLLRKMQPRYLDAIKRAISTFNYNRDEINKYCNLFKGWINND